MSFSKKSPLFNLPLFISVFIGFVFSTAIQADVLSTTVAADIQEPAGTYDAGAPTLLNLYAKIIIEEGICLPDNYDGCTFNDVLNDIDATDDFKPEVKVHITGDGYPDDGLLFNAKIRQRGDTSRYAPQKSFRIKLEKNIPLWRGERRIQLLKSFWELSRIRNKLSYDLFSDIPHIPSMRSQFVKFTLEDQGVSENLGLFTQVEYFGKEYLERRGWDKDSRIYKAEHFYFQDSPDYALNENGEPLDLAAFEKHVEIKRGDTHVEFVEMVESVINRDNDFQTQVFNKYFNMDNYLTWFAINILTNNSDTTAHNYYLYNPIATENFYFVPWDYDFAWGASIEGDDVSEVHRPRWWYSHGTLYSNNFHERFLTVPGNLELLKQAVAEIRKNYLNPQTITAKRDAYYDVIFPLISTSKDWDYIYLYGTDPEKIAAYNQVFNALSNNVEENYARFLDREDDPMPFYMSDPEFGEAFEENNNIFFNWGRSVSLTGQTITYDLELATTKEFSAGTIIQTISGITDSEYLLDWIHPKGTYYFRVVSRDAANPDANWQVSYDSSSLRYENNLLIYGVKEFYASQDGGIEPPNPTDSVSNPIVESSIILDGNDFDWNSLTSFPDDSDDIANDNVNIIDWDKVTMAHSDEDVYFLYKNHGEISANTSSTYIPWGWQVFIDADSNPGTGYRFSNTVGADFIIEGRTVERYTGTGSNWSWEVLGSVTAAMSNKTREFSFPRSWLGSYTAMKLAFQGVNSAYGGSTIDKYPDGASTGESFSYSFGTVTPPTNQAPVATGQNSSLLENTSATLSLEATDADNDALSLIITQQPNHGELSFTESSLVVSYTPNTNYNGTDTFSFKVNDGQVDSNTSTVSLEVVPVVVSEGVSNLVINSGITVNGNNGDWNGLTMFDADPADIAVSTSNVIDYLSAGMAHSNDTVYLTYQNNGLINPPRQSGTSLNWGWQTFIDINNDPASGYSLNDDMGAEYLVEGAYVYQYAGNGSSWEWIEMGIAQSKYQGNTIELSFPRSWMTQHNNVKVIFYGNNSAFGGSDYDTYPNLGNFAYSFGATGGFGEQAQVAVAQRQSSPVAHQPAMAQTTTTPTNTVTPSTSSSGGGSFSWLILFTSALLIRRRFVFATK